MSRGLATSSPLSFCQSFPCFFLHPAESGVFSKVRVCGAKRNNESPSGAFKRLNGLAPARWRGLAPTSLCLHSRIVLVHVIGLCISPRSAGETFLAVFLKKEQRFCGRSPMRSAAGHGSISSSRRSSWRAGEMFSQFHTAQAGTVSFSSGIKVRFLLAGSWASTGSARMV